MIWRSRGQLFLRRALSRAPGELAALARRERISPACLSELASGRRRHPTLPVAVALERALEIPVDAWIVPYEPDDFAPANAERGTLKLKGGQHGDQ